MFGVERLANDCGERRAIHLAGRIGSDLATGQRGRVTRLNPRGAAPARFPVRW